MRLAVLCVSVYDEKKKAKHRFVCGFGGVDVSLGVCFNITKLLIIRKELVWRVLFYHPNIFSITFICSVNTYSPSPIKNRIHFFGVWFSWVPFIHLHPPADTQRTNANWIVGCVQLLSGCSLYPLFRLLFKAIQWIKIMLNFMVLLLSHKFWGPKQNLPKSQVHLRGALCFLP